MKMGKPGKIVGALVNYRCGTWVASASATSKRARSTLWGRGAAERLALKLGGVIDDFRGLHVNRDGTYAEVYQLWFPEAE